MPTGRYRPAYTNYSEEMMLNIGCSQRCIDPRHGPLSGAGYRLLTLRGAAYPVRARTGADQHQLEPPGGIFLNCALTE